MDQQGQGFSKEWTHSNMIMNIVHDGGTKAKIEKSSE
jgi:hypothetical protein